ncbi:TolC family protein [Leptospira alstonii]|uniref:Outer membrane efflux protein n=2 Tax=Leptospira alstonii TaxID=28452 RepID=M6D8Q8_9LEPT|nr:TolC family protein [Leptospira alstonii]EMJ97648.1 outer membrane efflux protein [Leptospira alstonii serovar Sichuan str. 79601]EQA79324.1 outer membrane efflux protein [Leptospira alstonii serovar Pingchang str. 80-412]
MNRINIIKKEYINSGITTQDDFQKKNQKYVLSKFGSVFKSGNTFKKNVFSLFFLNVLCKFSFRKLNPIFLSVLILTALSSCTDDSAIKTNDGIVEPRLEEVTGVTTEKIKSISPEQELTIDELYSFAVERTERIALKEEAIQQADSQKAAAFASFFPSLSLVYNKFYRIPGPNSHFNPYYTEPNPLTGGSTTSSLPPTVGPGTRLLLTIPILNGVSQYTTYKAAGALTNVRLNEARYESGRLYLEIAQAYYNVLQLKEVILLEEKKTELVHKTIQERRRLFSLGRITRADLNGTEADFSRSEAILEDFRYQLKQAEMALESLVGAGESGLRLSIPKEVIVIPHNLMPEERISKRYDVIAAKENLRMAELNLKKAWGGHLPSVTLNNYYTIPEHNTTPNKDITMQLSINVPLLSAGTITAGVKQAESAVRQAELQLSQAKRIATDEIRKSYESSLNSSRLLSLYSKARNSAESNLSGQRRGFSFKSVSRLELLISETSFLDSEIAYRRAYYQHSLNTIWYSVAIGELPKLKKSKEEDKTGG